MEGCWGCGVWIIGTNEWIKGETNLPMTACYEIYRWDGARAASLGHESFAVTAAHYAQPEAVSGAKAAKVADTLG